MLAGSPARPAARCSAATKVAAEALAGARIAPEQIVASGGQRRGDHRQRHLPWRRRRLAVAERGPTPVVLITPASRSKLSAASRRSLKGAAILFQGEPAHAVERALGAVRQRAASTACSSATCRCCRRKRYDTPAPLAQGLSPVGTDSGHQNQPNTPPCRPLR